MAETEFRREMNRNYMIVTPERSSREKYAVQMLTGNQISGFLPFHEKRVNGECRYYYDITSKQPLERILEHRNLNGRELRLLLTDLLFTLKQAEKYLLDESSISLNEEMIYVEPDSFQCRFCFIPGSHGDFSDSFRLLAQYLLDHVNHRDGEAVVLGFSVLRESQKENFGIDDIEKCLRKQTEMSEKEETEEKEKGLEEANKEANKETNKEDHTRFHKKDYEERRRERLEEREVESIKNIKESESSKKGSEKMIYGLFCLLLGVGMAAVPAAAILTGGIERMVQYRWVIGAAEIILGTAIFLITAWSRQQDNGRNREESEKGVEWGGEEKLSGGKAEPWEVYFGEDSWEREEGWSEAMREKADEDGGDDEEEIQTVLLTVRDMGRECRKLVADSGGMEIPIGYYPFLIGKSKEMADFCLNDQGVSRLHIKIDEKDGRYTVTDLNSTNGTWVDGRLLEANETCDLNVNSEIEIAARKFWFR